MVVKMIGQIATIERQHGEDVALAVVEDLKRVWAKPHLSLVQYNQAPGFSLPA
jgi:uncharacterized Zn finger protein